MMTNNSTPIEPELLIEFEFEDRYGEEYTSILLLTYVDKMTLRNLSIEDYILAPNSFSPTLCIQSYKWNQSNRLYEIKFFRK